MAQTKRGGRRPGAGRPKGTPNKATLHRQQKIAETGATPLDVLIEGMRFHYSMYQVMLGEEVPDPKAMVKALEAAKDFASQAAPYVHPKLASIQQEVGVNVRIDRIERVLVPASHEEAVEHTSH